MIIRLYQQCWLKKQKDTLAPDRQEGGTTSIWTSGLIFGRGEVLNLSNIKFYDCFNNCLYCFQCSIPNFVGFSRRKWPFVCSLTLYIYIYGYDIFSFLSIDESSMVCFLGNRCVGDRPWHASYQGNRPCLYVLLVTFLTRVLRDEETRVRYLF